MSYQHTKSLCQTIVNCMSSGDSHKNAAAFWLQELEDGQDELMRAINEIALNPSNETISRALKLTTEVTKSRYVQPAAPLTKNESGCASFTTEEKRAI